MLCEHRNNIYVQESNMYLNASQNISYQRFQWIAQTFNINRVNGSQTILRTIKIMCVLYR